MALVNIVSYVMQVNTLCKIVKLLNTVISTDINIPGLSFTTEEAKEM